MNMQKTYSKSRMIVDCLRIHVWSYLKIYARKYRKAYYHLLSL
ncbi:hypothetical protein SAMN05421766_105114 [Zobellia uliginosa]|uniref:Transposase n=1 Tax=Zobellia uliginosa TaxID=143224 RepID=A0ABY1KYR3_9FLAO|nr:hypothetical protein SAMN05421766_105114 [Zobellia uliginosa]